MKLKPLHDKFKVKRVIVSTYQSVSGAGKTQMNELLNQSSGKVKQHALGEAIPIDPYNELSALQEHFGYEDDKPNPSKNFTKQIAFNVIPQIDSFMSDGSTKEEWKMVVETKKILDNKIDLTATGVRLRV